MPWLLAMLMMAWAGAAVQTVPRAGEEGTTRPMVVSDQPLILPPDPLRIPAPGVVVLETVIGPTGEVGHVTIVEAPDAISGAAAADALRRWVFEPATRNGQPAAVSVRITYPLAGATGQAPPRAVSADVVFPVGDGTESPKLLREVKPGYPAAAMRDKISGNLQLTCVVLPDGTPTDIRVRESLDPVLDQAAIDALKQWVFQPGRRGGIPVPVMVEVEFAFTPR